MRTTDELSENHYLVTHYVDVGQTGRRLDAFLKERYRKRSRAQIQRAIDEGAITVKREQGAHLKLGPRLKNSTQLLGGDEVLVRSEKKIEPPVSFDYKILFEDDWLFVIDKPANLPVHPAGRYFFNSLLTHLQTQGHRVPLNGDAGWRFSHADDPAAHPGTNYYLVHRIDKETSGVLAIAKEKNACISLTEQFAERTTTKRYLAIVKGIPPEAFEVRTALRRAVGAKVELKQETCADDAPGAQTASTEFKRIEVCGEYSVVECFPHTGRQHQIRVHLDSVGHPIVGDKLYGMSEEEALRFYERRALTPEAEAALILPRHALHAHELSFQHPVTHQRMTFRSELPEDLRAFADSQAR